MNINFLFETILILFAILVSNGIIYSLTIFNLNKKNSNSSENISIITNSSEKDGLALTSLIASNPIRLTSSESSASQSLNVTSSESSASQSLSVTSSESSVSQSLSVTSSESNISQSLSVTSSESSVSQDIFDNDFLMYSEISSETVIETPDTSITIGEMLPSNIEEFDSFIPLDSQTILNSQTVAE